MALGNLPVQGHPTIWMIVGQGPTVLACFSPLPPSLWETARYRLKYCLKGPINPNNQPITLYFFRYPGFIDCFCEQV